MYIYSLVIQEWLFPYDMVIVTVKYIFINMSQKWVLPHPTKKQTYISIEGNVYTSQGVFWKSEWNIRKHFYIVLILLSFIIMKYLELFHLNALHLKLNIFFRHWNLQVHHAVPESWHPWAPFDIWCMVLYAHIGYLKFLGSNLLQYKLPVKFCFLETYYLFLTQS